MKRRHMGVLTFIVCLLLTSATGWSQTDTARIVGTVKDSSGGIIPGATITVISDKTGQERTVLSNELGAYVVTALPAATYTVKASNPGFAAPEYKDIVLQVGQERVVNITMHPSAQSAEVTVNDSALPLVDTSSAAIGGNVSEREVAELPINGREISQLYLLAPGAVNFAGGTFDDIRFNGRSF